MNRRRTPLSHDLVWLSGWVFADLLLGLAVVFLAGSRGASPIEIAALTPSVSPTRTVPGPTYTPYPTYTPGPSPTPYPTYTPGPSPTPFPTWTPPPAPTPYPTYTPGPSPTPYPTYTPGPSATPYPTYTPGPTLRPSVTVVAALSIGLDQAAYDVTLQTDPTLFLSSSSADQQKADTQFRQQVHACLDGAASAKAGLVLGTGYNPDVTTGHALVKRVLAILRAEMPAVFGSAVQKDYHALTDDPLLNGSVSLEIYFVADPKVSLPRNLLGKSCLPPPKTWCQGSANAQSLIVYNYDVPGGLSFTLDGQNYAIKSANGTVAGGGNRTVGCIMVAAGTHNWSAGRASGSFNVVANKDPDPIRLCGSPTQLCQGGALPQTPAPGTQ